MASPPEWVAKCAIAHLMLVRDGFAGLLNPVSVGVGDVLENLELLEPFWRAKPLISEHSSAEERVEADFWSQRMYAVAEEHGYNKLDVIRAGAFRLKNPRPAPSKKRPKLKGGDK